MKELKKKNLDYGVLRHAIRLLKKDASGEMAVKYIESITPVAERQDAYFFEAEKRAYPSKTKAYP